MNRLQESVTRRNPAKIMLAGRSRERLAQLAAGLRNVAETEVSQAESGAEILEAAGTTELMVIDVELTDMSGLHLARILAEKHPFVNCALVSSLAADEFHEQTEGLGLLMQLPNPPGMEDAESLLSHYAAISSAQPGEKRQ